MASFSERQGITTPKSIQLTDMDAELRASLWNVCRSYSFSSDKSLTKDQLSSVSRDLFEKFFKRPVDDIPSMRMNFVKMIREVFLSSQWWHVYNLVEFLRQRDFSPTASRYEAAINAVLEREKSGYRFVDGRIIAIVSVTEMEAIKQAVAAPDRFAGASEHLKAALALYALKPNADYRNAVKEAISAVESAVRVISGLPKATFGEALKVVNSIKPIHKAMSLSFGNLYGYTSDEGGIRHSLIDRNINVDETDALYMIVCCSAFCNYLIANYQ